MTSAQSNDADANFGPLHKIVGEYEIYGILGEGNFSEVRYARHKSDRKVAIKIISRKLITSQDLDAQVEREISILKAIRHRHIVNLVHVMRTPSSIYLVIELVRAGTLTKLIERNGALTSDIARYFFRHLVAGLAIVHKHGIAHRDLKPDNLLLSYAPVAQPAEGKLNFPPVVVSGGQTLVLKLSDFGLARASALQTWQAGGLGGLDSESLSFVTRCGTPHFVPPEVLTEPRYNGFKADCWAAGVVLYYMLTGKLPFAETSIPELYRRIQAAEFTMPKKIADGAADLITHLLVPNPALRFTLKDVYQHPWFAEGLSEQEIAEFREIFEQGSAEKPGIAAAAENDQDRPSLDPVAAKTVLASEPKVYTEDGNRYVSPLKTGGPKRAQAS